jgi:hypothetical protein
VYEKSRKEPAATLTVPVDEQAAPAAVPVTLQDSEVFASAFAAVPIRSVIVIGLSIVEMMSSRLIVQAVGKYVRTPGASAVVPSVLLERLRATVDAIGV